MPVQPNPGMSRQVQQALGRRQDAGALNQMSPQAAQANPVPAPAPQSSLNKASAPADRPPQQTQKYQAQNQEDLIVEALIEQLNNIQEERKDRAKMPPMPPQGQPTPQVAPQGGAYENMGGCGYNKGGGYQNMGGFGYSSGFDQPAPVSVMQQQGDFYTGKYDSLNNYGQGSELNKPY